MLVDKQSELMSDLLFTVHQHGGDDVTWKPPIQKYPNNSVITVHHLKDERWNTRHVAIVERLNKMSMPSCVYQWGTLKTELRKDSWWSSNFNHYVRLWNANYKLLGSAMPNTSCLLVMKRKISKKNQISPALTIRPSYVFLSYGM